MSLPRQAAEWNGNSTLGSTLGCFAPCRCLWCHVSNPTRAPLNRLIWSFEKPLRPFGGQTTQGEYLSVDWSFLWKVSIVARASHLCRPCGVHSRMRVVTASSRSLTITHGFPRCHFTSSDHTKGKPVPRSKGAACRFTKAISDTS